MTRDVADKTAATGTIKRIPKQKTNLIRKNQNTSPGNTNKNGSMTDAALNMVEKGTMQIPGSLVGKINHQDQALLMQYQKTIKNRKRKKIRSNPTSGLLS